MIEKTDQNKNITFIQRHNTVLRLYLTLCKTIRCTKNMEPKIFKLKASNLSVAQYVEYDFSNARIKQIAIDSSQGISQ